MCLNTLLFWYLNFNEYVCTQLAQTCYLTPIVMSMFEVQNGRVIGLK